METSPLGSPRDSHSQEVHKTHDLIKKFLESNSEDDMLRYTGVKMITAILQNIIDHPTEEKYRKLKTSNAKLEHNVLSLKGGQEILQHLGFVKNNDVLILERKCMTCEHCEKVEAEMELLRHAVKSLDYLLYKEFGNQDENPTYQSLEKGKIKMAEEAKKKLEEKMEKVKEKQEILRHMEGDAKERHLDFHYVQDK